MTTSIDIRMDDTTHLPGLLTLPEEAHSLCVLAHGAGAGMRHAFLEDVSAALAERRVGTLRYEFPYMAAGKKRPDGPKRAQAAVRAAVLAGEAHANGRPLFAGGKSFGGRMTSAAAAAGVLPSVRGIAFLGFPLHAAGKPSEARGAHLTDVTVPMLFVQGTRDALADLTLMRRVTDGLHARATLHVVEGGDHSFKVLKRSGRSPDAVLDEIATAVSDWIAAAL